MNIYVIKFSNDTRVYVGQTSKPISERFTQHLIKLNAGTHHSKKLQKAFPKLANPTVELLEECEDSLVNAREVFWVTKLDSYTKGFNATLGGASAGIGHLHHAAKYDLDTYKCIVYFLAYTTWTHKEIAKELDVSVHVVTDICAQVNHTGLQEIIPIEYGLMLSQVRVGRSSSRKDWPDLVSPTGIRTKVLPNANKFAKDNNLSVSHLHAVLTGTRESHFGWTLYVNNI